MASVNKAILIQLYTVERKSIPDVAKAIGLAYSATRRLLLNAGVCLRSRTEGIRASAGKLGKHLAGKTREFTPEWKENIRSARLAHSESFAAGVSHKKGGYSEITRGPNKGRGVHVVMMEQRIGRCLDRDEVVHHIDHNKQNNDISNLILMSRAEHMKLHRAEQTKEAGNGKC